MKLKNAYQKSKYKGKKMDQTVNTIPDQNLSIRQLLDRHSRGLPIDATQRQGEFFDTEIPRFDDLTDMVEYRKMLEEKHKQLTEKVNEEQKKMLEAKLASEKASAPTEEQPKKSADL
jgi:hypothetical protein